MTFVRKMIRKISNYSKLFPFSDLIIHIQFTVGELMCVHVTIKKCLRNAYSGYVVKYIVIPIIMS